MDHSSQGRFARLMGMMALAACPMTTQAQPEPMVGDSLGGTLARDHQSRAMYFEGKHRRTYLVYMDHDFNANITFYDHDARAWSNAVTLDDCIAEVGWAKGIRDGHNVPNLWISSTGTIHVFYGSHGTPFKYARSTQPEQIDDWQLGMRVSNHATYPFFTELPTGEILVFYRYGPTGGYKNPFLAVQRTSDDGKTWGPLRKIGAFRNACKMNGRNAVYDPRTQRVWLNLALRPEDRWNWYLCQFDPATKHVLSWDGKTDLGTMPADDDLVEHGRIDELTLREIMVHQGVLYALLQRGAGYAFATWDGDNLSRHDIPASTFKDFQHGPMWTDDGQHIELYGIQKTDPPTAVAGGDVVVFKSPDAGETWDTGTRLADRRDVFHGYQGINLVTNYPGHGPFLIIAEATEKLPKDFKVTPQNHYNNPWRRGKRLYALDRHGKFIPTKP